MMIGSFSGISYRNFAAVLTPVALAGLAVVIAVIALVYRREFQVEEHLQIEARPVRVHRPLVLKSLTASIVMIIFFFAGWPVPKVALVAGAMLLVTRKIKPERIYREIDWSLLVLFVGLFIVVAGIEKTSLSRQLFEFATRYHLERTAPMSIFAGLLSNIVSNVPAVLVFKPLVPHLANPAHAWLTLAMSSTFAGNLTILGSVANLIVVQKARQEVRITFWDYAKAGIPVTLVTIAIGICWL
jgi:Na+/H+ antiporter NhaD/arsenite permease-like protein